MDIDTSRYDLDSDDHQPSGPPPTKIRKLDGAAKYPNTFNPDWTKKWPCIETATNISSIVQYANVCSAVEIKGSKTSRRHLDGKQHQDIAEALEKQQRISQFSYPVR